MCYLIYFMMKKILALPSAHESSDSWGATDDSLGLYLKIKDRKYFSFDVLII